MIDPRGVPLCLLPFRSPGDGQPKSRAGAWKTGLGACAERVCHDGKPRACERCRDSRSAAARSLHGWIHGGPARDLAGPSHGWLHSGPDVLGRPIHPAPQLSPSRDKPSGFVLELPLCVFLIALITEPAASDQLPLQKPIPTSVLALFLSGYHGVLAVKALRCSRRRTAPLLYSPESMPPLVGIEP